MMEPLNFVRKALIKVVVVLDHRRPGEVIITNGDPVGGSRLSYGFQIRKEQVKVLVVRGA